VHAQLVVDHRHPVAAHLAGAGVIDRRAFRSPGSDRPRSTSHRAPQLRHRNRSSGRVGRIAARSKAPSTRPGRRRPSQRSCRRDRWRGNGPRSAAGVTGRGDYRLERAPAGLCNAHVADGATHGQIAAIWYQLPLSKVVYFHPYHIGLASNSPAVRTRCAMSVAYGAQSRNHAHRPPEPLECRSKKEFSLNKGFSRDKRSSAPIRSRLATEERNEQRKPLSGNITPV
jgi:hypothetical protein